MDQLSELRDRLMALPALEHKMSLLQGEIQKAESDVSNLLRQYEKECRDVNQMQGGSLSSFLLKVVGKYEDRLAVERREEIHAKLQYDRVVLRRDGLLRESDELSARISALRGEERAYQKELAARRDSLSVRFMEPEGRQYAELETRRMEIITQMTEIKEAQSAAARAASTARQALKSLESAEGWATFDMFTRGGVLSHMAKYSHIDSAEDCFHTLSSQLRELKTELSDVQGLSVSGLSEISSAHRIVDFWFDNIFTDLSVRGQIKDNAEEVSRILQGIRTAESALHERLREEEIKLADNKRREEELLLSLR